VTELLITFMDT